MFTSFNSAELIVVHSLDVQAELRKLLTQHGMEHTVSIRNPHDTGGFFPVADPAQLLSQEMEYTFYVYQKDLQQAHLLLEKEGYYDSCI